MTGVQTCALPICLFDQQYLGKLQQEGAKLDPEVQAAISMKESAERKPYSITSSGIAIIPVQGTLMKKSTWLSSFSGNSSYERIGAMLETALADRGVQAVVFDIDSPGGETHGAFELSDMIYKARGLRSPIVWLILSFIPILNIVAWWFLSSDLAEMFGKTTGWKIFLFLIPGLAHLMLAFGDAKADRRNIEIGRAHV